MKFWFATILLLIFSFFSISAQERKELEQRRDQLSKEIAEANELLKSIGQKRERSVETIVLLQKRIELRKLSINNLRSEIALIDDELKNLTRNIGDLETQIKNIKISYANDILLAYKLKERITLQMFIFGSNNFDQAFRRFRYLSEISKSRRNKAERLAFLKNDLSKQLLKLSSLKNEKKNLLDNLDREVVTLNKDLSSLDNEVKRLRQEEEKIRKKIRENQRLAEELNKRIRDLISKEMSKDSKGKMRFELTPEEIALSVNFEKNKQKLPWPTEKGFITERFGNHEHPVFKGVVTRNDGVDIATENNAAVRSVFDGVISNVIIIPGLNRVVLIRHGKFLSVYSNLEEVYVQKGQKIKTKEIIGKVANDTSRDFTIVKFQIWKENEKLNPEEWLARKK